MERKVFGPGVSDMVKESGLDLGFVSNVLEAEEKLKGTDSGSIVSMNIEASTQQEREEFVNDFKKEFKRRGLRVKIKTYTDLGVARGWYIMTITKK